MASTGSRILYIVIRGLGALPLSARRRLAAVIGRVITLFPSRDKRICELQIGRFLPETKIGASAVYQHLITVLLESLDLTPILSNPSLLDDRKLTDYWNNRDRSKGIIALSAHMGNWELVAATAIRHRVPLQVVGREARQSAWQDALERIRRQYGAEVLWRSDSSAVKKMLSLLKEGSVIAALIDQDTDVRSEFSSFFGVPAKTPSALIDLGLRAGAAFVTAFTIRLPGGKYQMMVEPIHLREGISVGEVLSVYHQRLEELIRQYPDQWVWVHKRWRSQESGTRLSSREYINYLAGAL